MDREVTELVISEWGTKCFLGWERLFEKYPLSGVIPHKAGSQMVQADAELKLQKESQRQPERAFASCAD